MKPQFPFLLSGTVLLLVVILLISFLASWSSSRIDIYWAFLFFLPGLSFFLLVLMVKSIQPNWINALFFIVLSTGLYTLTFFGSIIAGYAGFIIAPGLGALAFLALVQGFLKIKFSQLAVLMSLLAGPISGGLTLYTENWGDECAQVLYLPIILWWIYMTLLIDISTYKTKHV